MESAPCALFAFGRGEERRAGEDESSQRAHSDAKSEAEARAPVRHSIQCPWTPCTAGTGRLLRLQFTIPPSGSGCSGLPADAILIPAAVLHPHTSLSYSEIPQLFATACILSLPLSSLLPLIRSLHQSLHNTLSLSLITHSTAGPGLLRLGGVSSSPLLCGQA